MKFPRSLSPKGLQTSPKGSQKGVRVNDVNGRQKPAKDEVLALIKACKKGKAESQQALYELFSPRMFSICLRYAPDYHSAEDLLQEGFIKVFRALEQFRGDGSFEGWMRRIFVNTAIEKHRKKHHLYPLLEVQNTDRELLDDEALENLAADDLLEMIASLSPGYRTVFNLFAVEGYSHREISEKLQISEGTSKSQLARARNILQKQVMSLRASENESTIKVIGG